MWSALWKWVTANRMTAVIFAIVSLVATASVSDGWSARRAAARYFALARGWAEAYQRDTTATRQAYEERIKQLTADRDSYRKKWEAARGKMGAPWTPPSNAKALQERFNRLGYRGVLR